MNTRKILSTLVLMSTIVSFSQSTMAISINPHRTNYAPPAKIQRLMRLEPTLMKYIEGMSSPKIFALGNFQLRKIYLFELSLQKEQLENIFSEMEYTYSDTQYDGYLKEIRTRATAIRDILREVQKVGDNKSNPFVIPTEDRTRVEADVLTTQKDLVGYLKEMLQMYDGQDIKKSNPSLFHFESEMGTIDVNLEKNTSILSWVTGNTEADMKLSATMDLTLPGSPIFDEEGNMSQGVSQSIKGTIMIDGNMKIIDKEMYLTLQDYVIDMSSSKDDLSIYIKQVQSVLDTIKGKTVRINLTEGSREGPSTTQVISTIKTVLDILEQKPLLTPYKGWEGRYALEPKKSTLDTIGMLINGPMSNGEFNSMRKDFRVNKLWYRDITDGYEYMIRINENGTTGDIKLLSMSGAYTATMNLTNKRGNKATVEIRNGYMKFDADDTGGEVHVLWENKNLSLKASSMGQVFSVTGPFSIENTNLTITFNDEEIGTIKATGTTAHTEYEINLGFSLPSPWKFSAKGTADIEHGTFTIEKPTDSINAEDIMPEGGASVFDELDL